MVQAAKMPLPRALRIAPRIVAMWNRRKGRIDEMTRLLEDMKFYIAQASPKQKLLLREIQKFAVSTYLASKRCFPAAPVPKGQGFAKIQEHLKQQKPRVTMKEILHKLCT